MTKRRERLASAARTPTRRSRPAVGRRAAQPSFGELFENANDIILVNDRAGRIIAANRAAREFGGYSAHDVERGVSLREVLPADEYQAAMVVTQRALDGLPIPEVYEREVVLHDRGRRFLELRSNVLRRRGRPYALQTIARDVTEAKEAVAFHASLLQVSQALLTAPSLDQLGQVVCDEAMRILRVDGVYLWLRQGDELVGGAAAGQAARQFVGLRRALADSFVGQIYRAAQAVVVNDFQHSAYNFERARAFGVRALLAVPLRRSGEPVGVLVCADNLNPQRFNDTLRDRALIFAGQSGVAIEAALARAREEEEGRVSAALLHVTRAIRECVGEAEMLSQIARSAREVLQCDWTFVTLWDERRGRFRVVAAEGWSAEVAAEIRLVDFRPDVSDELRPLLMHQTVAVTEPTREWPQPYQRWNISSFLAVPMVRAGGLIGAICVGYRARRGAFPARERRITEGIAAQAAVAVENTRLIEDLRRANALKSEFLSTMSHELRTPLSAILGYTELMREGVMGVVGDEQLDALDRILVNGRALLELISMTLDVNRLEAGRIAVEPSEFALDELIDELRGEFAVRAAELGRDLQWPPPSSEAPLRTDRGKLKVILRNLIDNALKFTLQGSVTVAVQWARARGRVRVSVRDTGIGIPAEALASVFEMFRQLGDGRVVGRGGVGLGLYLVRRYTRLLGGEVTVDSAPGEGSTFTVDIPTRF